MRALPTTHPRRLVVMTLGAALLLSACSDDTPTTTPSPTSTTTGESMEPGTYEVTATDYAFGGIPAEMAAGSTLAFHNASEAEVHELVAINLGDDERPMADILAELQASFESTDAEVPEPAFVAIQGPGGQPSFTAIGDGELDDPGRYLFLCAIQQGVDPEAYFAEAQRMQEAGEEGPVDIEGSGPPHLALGMVAEARVS